MTESVHDVSALSVSVADTEEAVLSTDIAEEVPVTRFDVLVPLTVMDKVEPVETVTDAVALVLLVVLNCVQLPLPTLYSHLLQATFAEPVREIVVSPFCVNDADTVGAVLSTETDACAVLLFDVFVTLT